MVFCGRRRTLYECRVFRRNRATLGSVTPLGRLYIGRDRNCVGRVAALAKVSPVGWMGAYRSNHRRDTGQYPHVHEPRTIPASAAVCLSVSLSRAGVVAATDLVVNEAPS